MRLGGLILLASASACATSGTSSGPKKAERTVDTIDQLLAHLTVLGADLDNSGAALAKIQESVGSKGVFNRETVAKADIPTAFEQYRTSLASLRSTSKKVASADGSLAKDMAAYMKTWEENLAQVQTASLREASLARKTEIQKHFDAAKQELGERWTAYQTLLTQMNELEVALSTDLTPAGVSAIDDPIDDAREGTETAKKGFATAAERLGKLADALRAGSLPPPPAAAAAAEPKK